MSKIVVSLRIEEEVLANLDAAARFLGMTRSALMEQALAQFVERHVDGERSLQERLSRGGTANDDS